MLRCFCFVWLIVLLYACQSGKELHYFKQGDNYYRISIKEHAFLSSSRYQSGYYDEIALDKYFGEIRRPDTSGNFLKFQQDSAGKINVAPSNTKLVMILSTKSEAISDQISAFAENELMLETIARLANKDAINKNRQIKGQIELTKKKIEALSSFGGNTIGKLGDSSTKIDISAYLFLFINKIATDFYGRKIAFKDFEEASSWYLNNF